MDRTALKAAGISADLPIELDLSNVKLGSVLELLLSPHKLDWLIEDEVLKITTQAAAAKSLQVRTYDVAPLLTPQLSDRELIETLTGTIDPESWNIRKGDAAAHVVRNVLVVSQTRRNHDRIAELLKELRTAQE